MDDPSNSFVRNCHLGGSKGGMSKYEAFSFRSLLGRDSRVYELHSFTQSFK
jgi:hypothetical protein